MRYLAVGIARPPLATQGLHVRPTRTAGLSASYLTRLPSDPLHLWPSTEIYDPAHGKSRTSMKLLISSPLLLVNLDHIDPIICS